MFIHRLLLALLLLLPLSAQAQESTLAIGEQTGYSGIYCFTHDDASTMLRYVVSEGENSPITLNGSCVVAHANITVLKKHQSGIPVDASRSWTVLEVEVDGIPVNIFVLTALPVVAGREA